LSFHFFQHRKIHFKEPSPMGTRRIAPLLLAVVVASACNEQEQPDGVTGPQFKPGPPPSASACDPGSLNSLINGYFPGGTSSDVKALKDAMIAATAGADKRDNGFQILDAIGSISRNPDYSLDPVAGSELTKGIIKCMFDAITFSPTFPSNAIYNFAPALSHASGGAFYVRGGTSAGTDTVVGALIAPGDITVLSGVAPPLASLPDAQPTWADILDGNTGSEGRVLIYGYPVRDTEGAMLDPLVYEWATIPPAAEFSPGAIVAVCDGNTATTAMVHETSVGVLAYSTGNAICGTEISMVLRESGWGPRELAARLARVLVSSLTPPSLQAAVAARSGSGGTVTTVKSKFSTKPVETVTLSFDPAPPKTMFVRQMPYSVRVRATTPVDGVTTGVNGTCIYLVGSNNNGQNTALAGNHECDNEPPGAVSAITKSIEVGTNVIAGYAEFALSVTKTGGLNITGTSTDATGKTGVVDRDGQTFIITPIVKSNIKP
jgi:hypothetical protein